MCKQYILTNLCRDADKKHRTNLTSIYNIIKHLTNILFNSYYNYNIKINLVILFFPIIDICITK